MRRPASADLVPQTVGSRFRAVWGVLGLGQRHVIGIAAVVVVAAECAVVVEALAPPKRQVTTTGAPSAKT